MDRLKKIWADPVWSKGIYDILKWTSLLVVGAAITYFMGLPPFRRDVPQEPPVFIREKSAGELIEHLRNFPPLQRETVVQNSYVGRWVQWEGRVKYIGTYNEPSWKNGFLVGVETEGEIFRSYLLFTTEWRERIENLRVGDLITFTGMINDISVAIVDVIYASFEMSEQKK
jgi:hypothetical protein